jgi:hypothetical protein
MDNIMAAVMLPKHHYFSIAITAKQLFHSIVDMGWTIWNRKGRKCSGIDIGNIYMCLSRQNLVPIM